MIEFTVPLPVILGLLSGTIMPVLVGFITARVTHSGIKAVLLAAIAFATQILIELGDALSNGTPYDLGLALLSGLGTFIVAVALHFGFWRATGVAEKVQEIGPQLGARHSA